MKHLKLIIAATFILASFIASSCSNTDEVALITDKTWVIESVNMAGMDMTSAEILAEEGAEYQMTLKADGTLMFADNFGMNPIAGKWEFQEKNTKFVISGIEVGKSDVNTINKLTATDLWIWHLDGTNKMIMHYKLK